VPLQARPRSAPPAAAPVPVAAPRRRAGLWIGAALAAAVGVGLWWLWAADGGVSATAPSAAVATKPAPLATPAAVSTPALDAPRRVEGAVIDAAKPAPIDAPALEASVPASASLSEEVPRSAAKAQQPAPRLNSQNARCTEIIARVSLGEELSAAERAFLQGECRR
jgi:hypothetical protein